MSEVDDKSIPENLIKLQKAMESRGITELKKLLETDKEILKPVKREVKYYTETLFFGIRTGHEDVVINPICFPGRLVEFQTTPEYKNVIAMPHYLEKLKMLIEHGADLTTPSNVASVFMPHVSGNRRWIAVKPAVSPVGWFCDKSNIEIAGLLEDIVRGRLSKSEAAKLLEKAAQGKQPTDLLQMLKGASSVAATKGKTKKDNQR